MPAASVAFVLILEVQPAVWADVFPKKDTVGAIEFLAAVTAIDGVGGEVHRVGGDVVRCDAVDAVDGAVVGLRVD